MALSPKQQQFCREYIIDLNATQAAIRAGYAKSGAHVTGHRLLSDAKIADCVAELQQKRSARTEITADRVLAELAKIGFSDIRNVVAWQPNATGMTEDEDGEQRIVTNNEVTLIASTEISDDTAASIAEISQSAQGALKIKLHDKRAALVDLGRHLGMFKERVEHSGPEGGPIEVKDVSPRELVANRIAGIIARKGP